MPSSLGWMLMEAPAAVTMALVFMAAPAHTLAGIVFLVLWEAHYLHRAFVYPFRRTSQAKPIPLAVPLMGLTFNVLNGWLNGYWLFVLSGGYLTRWLWDPRFVAGAALFVAGFVLNRWADAILRRLRAPGETGYSIPYGPPYRFVSCPNYLGEITMWLGWALATWSAPGVLFAVWSIANLAPRARDYHRWYRAHFPEYPPERTALVPGLW